MKLTHEIIDKIFVIRISGEVDANSSLELDKYVRDAILKGYSAILVNCKYLEYISSAGLGVFISYIDELQNKKGAFSFCALRTNVFDVFKLLGLSKLVHIAENEQESIDFLKRI